MFCRNCGSEIADGAKFCENCGTQVAQPEAAVPPVEDTVAGVAAGEAQTPAVQGFTDAATPSTFNPATAAQAFGADAVPTAEQPTQVAQPAQTQPFNAQNVAQNIGADVSPTAVPPANVPPTGSGATPAAGGASSGGGGKGPIIGIIAAVVVVLVIVFGAFSCGGGSSSSSSSAASASSSAASSASSTTSSSQSASSSASSASSTSSTSSTSTSSKSATSSSMQTVGNNASGYITVPSSWIDNTGAYDSNIVDSTEMVCYADPSSSYSSTAFGHTMYSDAIQLRCYATSYSDIAKQCIDSYGDSTYSKPDSEETTFNGNKCYIITTSVPKDDLYLCNIVLDRDGNGKATVLFTIQGKQSTIETVLGYAASWSKTK